MSTFEKVLRDKLKKLDLDIHVKTSAPERSQVDHSLSNELLKWLNHPSKISKKYYPNLEKSSYSEFKKDPAELEKIKIQREKQAWDGFLCQVSSADAREAAEFFYRHGGRGFMSFSLYNLKKDYRKLALSMHPDRYFRQSPSVQRQSQENFRTLQTSYEILKMQFSRAK